MLIVGLNYLYIAIIIVIISQLKINYLLFLLWLLSGLSVRILAVAWPTARLLAKFRSKVRVVSTMYCQNHGMWFVFKSKTCDETSITLPKECRNREVCDYIWLHNNLYGF